MNEGCLLHREIKKASRMICSLHGTCRNRVALFKKPNINEKPRKRFAKQRFCVERRGSGANEGCLLHREIKKASRMIRSLPRRSDTKLEKQGSRKDLRSKAFWEEEEQWSERTFGFSFRKKQKPEQAIRNLFRRSRPQNHLRSSRHPSPCRPGIVILTWFFFNIYQNGIFVNMPFRYII